MTPLKVDKVETRNVERRNGLSAFKARRTAIGLEIDGRVLRAAQLVRKNGRFTLEAATTVTRRESHGELQAADVRRLAEVFDRQGFTGSAVHLCLPSRLQLAGLLELPPAASGAPLTQLAHMELARMHRCDPQTLEMAWWDLPARRRGVEGTEVMATACRLDDSERLLDLFDAEHLSVHALDVVSWGMCRTALPSLNGKRSAVLLNLGWESCTIVLMHCGVVVYERVLPEAGLQPLHERLAKELDMPSGHVDILMDELTQSAAGAQPATEGRHADAQRLLEMHFAPLVREVAISTSYISQRYDNVEFPLMMMSGCGADLAGLDQQISQTLEMPVQVARPSGFVECPARLSRQARDPGLVLAIGMAMYAEE